jgi:uncharacterized protein (DUF362 family)
MDQRASVAIEIASNYERETVSSAVTHAVNACGGWAQLVKSGDRVLVKPNCISGAPADRPVQTHPAVITEVCRQLIDVGAKPFVGDSPAWGSLPTNLRVLGVTDELNRLGVEIVEFKRPTRVPNPRGQVFDTLKVDAAAIEADAIVNVPKFKAHCQLVLTVAIKNMFGCVCGRRKAWWHVKAGSYDNYFGRMLVETFELLRPVITIVDGIVAMQGRGPMKGSPCKMGLILASTDGPALERVAADLVGVKPSRLRTLLAARELDVGTPYLDRIDIAGPPIAEVRPAEFEIPKLMPIGFSIPRLVKGALKHAWMLHKESRVAKTQAS